MTASGGAAAEAPKLIAFVLAEDRPLAGPGGDSSPDEIPARHGSASGDPILRGWTAELPAVLKALGPGWRGGNPRGWRRRSALPPLVTSGWNNVPGTGSR